MYATIGHNKPPSIIESGKEAFIELSSWLKDNPVIQSPQEAKDGGAYVERTRVSLNEMETERKGKTEPINVQLSAINGTYRAIREPLESALKVLRQRLTTYAAAEEAKRAAEAERLRQEAQEAERIAREAEAKEADAIACADVGECSDVGEAIAEADQAFGEFKKANRQAAVAERGVAVRIGSVMGRRSLSMRTTEVLKVEDACAAIKAMGLTPKITDAILSSARDYRKEYEELPNGVIATFERSL